MKEISYSLVCKEILEKKEHVLIGISPFNSYFSEETIRRLIHWGRTNFKDFHLFVPDILPYFNFLAIGYSEDKALKKTMRQIRYLQNKINRAFSSLELEKISADKLITVSDFSKNCAYSDIYSKCLKRYNNDEAFKKGCFEGSTLVLKKHTVDIEPSMLEISSKYLLGELPFYIDTPKILGVESSLFVYHESIDFFVDLYKDREKSSVPNNQGHLVLKLDEI